MTASTIQRRDCHSATRREPGAAPHIRYTSSCFAVMVNGALMCCPGSLLIYPLPTRNRVMSAKAARTQSRRAELRAQSRHPRTAHFAAAPRPQRVPAAAGGAMRRCGKVVSSGRWRCDHACRRLMILASRYVPSTRSIASGQIYRVAPGCQVSAVNRPSPRAPARSRRPPSRSSRTARQYPPPGMT